MEASDIENEFYMSIGEFPCVFLMDVQYNIVSYDWGIVPYCIVLYFTVIHCTVLYNNVLNCTLKDQFTYSNVLF